LTESYAATAYDAGELEESVPYRNEAPRFFYQFAGISAILAGVATFAFTLSFVLALRGRSGTAVLTTALLAASGLLGIVVVCALFDRLREVEPGFAVLALVLGTLGGAGALIYGAHGLSNLVGPEQVPAGPLIAVDPRGVLTSAATGLAVLIFARLIEIGPFFPVNLKWVGYALGVLLLIVYLGRLIVLDPSQPILQLSAILVGFVLGPLWNVWIGLSLIRTR
jgi:hypothetical protein